MTTPNWHQVKDSELIQSCLDGHEQAWQALIHRYSRLIYAIPLRFGIPQPLAEEIFQETCMILLEKLDTLQNTERLNSWLMTVTRRLCIQLWRQNDRDPQVALHDIDVTADGSIEAELLQIEQYHFIHEALDRLPERDRQLLHALFFEIPPLTYDLIAEKFDIALGSIGPTRARSLKKLHRELTRLEQLRS